MQQPFTTATRIHDTAGHRRVLEFVLSGAIPYEHRDRTELYRQAGQMLHSELARHGLSAVVVNLLGFDYVFGNEMAAMLVALYSTLARSGGGKMAIVATGETARNLASLLSVSHLEKALGLKVHPSVGSALEQMTDVPALKGKAPAGSKSERGAGLAAGADAATAPTPPAVARLPERDSDEGHGPGYYPNVGRDPTGRRIDPDELAPDILLEEKCPQCGRDLRIVNFSPGDAIICSAHPPTRVPYVSCTYILQNLALLQENLPTGLRCPLCKQGELVGTIKLGPRYICSRAPECGFSSAGVRYPRSVTGPSVPRPGSRAEERARSED